MPYRIVRLETTGSTMTDAAGQPPGTVIVAEEQTAGRGRLGRKWHSERGLGLYFSVVLDLSLSSDTLPALTLALGLAAREAIQQVAGVASDLRWPNDVLIGDKKCAGILVELQEATAIAGVGVNVNHASFPDDIAGLATSLRLATGREQSREDLLEKLLASIDAYASLMTTEGPDAILRLFAQASSYVHGRKVIVGEGETALEGTTDGLDPSGFLWLRTTAGARHLIRAGGVRPAT